MLLADFEELVELLELLELLEVLEVLKLLELLDLLVDRTTDDVVTFALVTTGVVVGTCALLVVGASTFFVVTGGGAWTFVVAGAGSTFGVLGLLGAFLGARTSKACSGLSAPCKPRALIMPWL